MDALKANVALKNLIGGEDWENNALAVMKACEDLVPATSDWAAAHVYQDPDERPINVAKNIGFYTLEKTSEWHISIRHSNAKFPQYWIEHSITRRKPLCFGRIDRIIWFSLKFYSVRIAWYQYRSKVIEGPDKGEEWRVTSEIWPEITIEKRGT